MNTQEIARRLEIAARAPQDNEGVRVAVKYDPDTWYLGTILEKRGSRIVVGFDDGSTEPVTVNHSTVKVVRQIRKNKAPLTDAQVAEMLGKSVKDLQSKIPDLLRYKATAALIQQTQMIGGSIQRWVEFKPNMVEDFVGYQTRRHAALRKKNPQEYGPDDFSTFPLAKKLKFFLSYLIGEYYIPKNSILTVNAYEAGPLAKSYAGSLKYSFESGGEPMFGRIPSKYFTELVDNGMLVRQR